MDEQSESRSVFVMSDQVDPVSAEQLFRGGLLVLRPVLRTVVITATCADGFWPAQVADDLAQLMLLARSEQAPDPASHEPTGPGTSGRSGRAGRSGRSGDPRVLVEVDRDDQFTMLLALAVHSTGVQGYGDYRTCLFDGGDGGMSLWLCLTRSEHEQLCWYLTHGGVDPVHLLG